jgi:TetR/AcrR family transcriptional regulator, transcriptional repressor for nem operon
MRDAIVQAAKTLLWDKGYESMSPRAILDASGAGQGSLYHHFRSKRQLATIALAEVSADLTATADAIFAADTPPMERLRAYLLLDRNGLKGCRLGRLANEADVLATPDLRAPIAGYFARLGTLVEAAVSEAQAEGALDDALDAATVAAVIVAVVQGGFLLSRAGQDAGAIDRATRGAWSLLSAPKGGAALNR